ncbi:RidA family protein [Streptomyces sp. NPDC058424]|uniref:RidA family protein n=1 Tax=Streptomyces sp. NPDC058424 TaxID=3346491 RepID=UPI003650E717
MQIVILLVGICVLSRELFEGGAVEQSVEYVHHVRAIANRVLGRAHECVHEEVLGPLSPEDQLLQVCDLLTDRRTPLRSTVEVKGLAPGCLAEIEVVAEA